MKKTIILFALNISICFVVSAQDCTESFANFTEGMRTEMTHYNKKGEISSVSKNKILRVANDNDTTIARVEAQMVDKKGRESFSSAYDVKCHAGILYMDMRSLLGNEMTQPLKDFDVKVVSKDIEYPAKLEPGSTLPDADMTITTSTSGITLMNMRFSMTNRKVVARESVTTPAGTFDCYKITFDMETKIGFARKSTNAMWIAPKIGAVKTESYDKKGNLDYKSELTLMEK